MDLVAQPVSALNMLVDFCGINASFETLRTTASHVRVDRAYAYRSSSALQGFADGVADTSCDLSI